MSVLTLEWAYAGLFDLVALMMLYNAWWLLTDAQQERGAPEFAAVCIASAIWALGESVHLIVPMELGKLWAMQGTMVAKHLTPAVWLLFALQYTNHRHRDNQTYRRIVLGIGGLLGLAAVTNPWHHLYWAEYVVQHQPVAALITTGGPLFWLGAFWNYFAYFMGVSFLLQFGVSSQSSLYRGQLIVISLGGAVAWLFAFITEVGWSPIEGVSLAPFGLGILAIAVTASLYRHKFFDITPVARERVIDTIDEAVIIVDADGRLVLLNPMAKRILPETVTVGEPVDVLPAALAGRCPPNTMTMQAHTRGPHTWTASDEAGSGAGVDDQRELKLTVDDTERYYDVQISPLAPEMGPWARKVVEVDVLPGHVNEYEQAATDVVLDDSGDAVSESAAVANPALYDYGYVIILHDVTELKRQNERLEQFASMVSHDLRNPLETANGYLDFARDTGQDEAFDKIERAHDRMERIIDDVLMLAREGRTIGTRTDAELGPIVEAAWENVETKMATLTLEVADDCTFFADTDRLLNLFENLFRNAVEHGGSDVDVCVGTHDDGHGFYVIDDGVGIPAEDHEKVFEEGYTTRTGGTGFGLNIVERIVTAHEWEIELSDSARGGVRFDIRTETETETEAETSPAE